MSTNRNEINKDSLDENTQNPNINEDEETELNIPPLNWHVKLYKLNQQNQWDDNGTGFTYFSYEKTIIDNNILEAPRLIMIKENSNIELFNILINDNIEFHIQRGTILTWKTNNKIIEDNIAISFQRREDIKEIWKKLCLIQKKDSDSEQFLFYDPFDALYDVSLQNLSYIAHEIRPDMDTQRFLKLEEHIKNYNENSDFISELGVLLEEEEKKLEKIKSVVSNCSINTNCESLINDNIDKNNENNINNIGIDQQIENLSLIFLIFKNLILLADRELMEILLNDDHYLITFGAFEFDFETQKVIPHRKYFKEIVKFKNILNIKDKDILDKIHMNHRLSYLRDTAIGRFIEENTLKVINLMIQLNNNKIVKYFLYDLDNLNKILSLMNSNDLKTKKNACLFLVELMECTRNLMMNKITFYETLNECGLLSILEKIILDIPQNSPYQKYIDAIQTKRHYSIDSLDEYTKDDDATNMEVIKISVIEIIIFILSSVPNLIKEYIEKNNSTLLIELCKLMLCNENFGIKYEISQIVKTLIENDIQDKKNILDDMIFDNALVIFVNYLDIPINQKFKNEIVSNKQLVIEILCHVLYKYSTNLQYWLNQNDVCGHVLKILNENSKILDLHVIKFIKGILIFCDWYFISTFFNIEIFKKLEGIFNKNKKKENLVFSAVCELFDSARFIKDGLLLEHFYNLGKDLFMNEENKKYFVNLNKAYLEKDNPKNDKLSIFINKQIDNFELNYLEPSILSIENDDDYYDDKDLFLEKKRNIDNLEDIFDDEKK